MFKYTGGIIVFLLSLTVNQGALAQDDPTRPFNYSATSMATPDGKKLVLESIISVNDEYTVIVSGKVMKMFDYIGEYQLAEVNDQQIVLRSDKQRLTLTIFKDDIVKASTPKEK